jgi:GTPase SAR1 family protein
VGGPVPRSVCARLAAVTGTDTTDLRAALGDLAAVLERVRFDLPTHDQAAGRELTRQATWSIREYLLPRLGDLDAPTVAVLVGSTGAGKSTLLNSLAQRAVAAPGAVRPTTRVPTVWTHATNERRYAGDLMPSFRGDDHPLRIETHDDPTFTDLTVVDTPDVDSVVAEHRVLAEEVLAVADLCVFVTTAQRYADAVPWEILRGVRDRSLPLVVVLNRVPEGRGDEIAADLGERLGDEGLRPTLGIVRIAEQEALGEDGRLPARAVAPLLDRLLLLSSPQRRRELLAEAVTGSLGHTLEVVGALDSAAADEQREAERLVGVAADAYAGQLRELTDAIEDGRIIRTEVLQRWQEFVGTGELVRVLSAGVGRVRGWLQRVLGTTDTAARTVRTEAGSQLAAAVHRRADRAASTVAAAWDGSPAGQALLAPELWRADEETGDRAAAAVDDWLGELAVLIEAEGGGPRRVAQVASVGVNVVAVVLMLAVFSQTGGLTGAEVGITAGAAALQQRILEHLFGTAAARGLIEQASERLREAVGEVLAADRRRFDDRVTTLVTDDAVLADLAAAVRRVETAADRVVRELADG